MSDPRIHNRAARRRAGRRGRRRSILSALTAAALALPGIGGPSAPAGADTPIEKWSSAYAYSYYREDNLSPSRFSGAGSRERYRIHTHQLELDIPVGQRIDGGVDLIYESMSGATPWYVEPNPDDPNKPLQAMTGATVSEQRLDVNARGNYYFDNGKIGGNIGGSVENDYTAIYAGVNADRHINDGNTTLSAGLGFSVDTIEPTGGGQGGRVLKEDKSSVGLFASVSQIMSRSTVVQATLNYKMASGFLSDPYKLAWIDDLPGGRTVNDSRPGDRHQMALLGRLRRHFESVNGSLHLDYRFHAGSWEITSHTADVKWYQNFLGGRLQLIPGFRYYSQSQAYFYEPVYDDLREDGLASSDYRLSPYGAIAYNLRGQVTLKDWLAGYDWRFGLFYERYLSGSQYALGDILTPNPGLVKFHMFYGSIQVRF